MSFTLVGKTIQKIKIAADDMAIMFVCDDGEHIARCDADCCSHTWIENVDINVLGFPCTVLEVVDLDLPEEEEEWDGNGEYIQFYGLKIVTDRGAIELDYRNSSNGYYGGSLSWPDDKWFYGGVYGQNISEEEWKDAA